MIRDAMQDEGRVALARIVMAHREHIIMLEPRELSAWRSDEGSDRALQAHQITELISSAKRLYRSIVFAAAARTAFRDERAPALRRNGAA